MVSVALTTGLKSSSGFKLSTVHVSRLERFDPQPTRSSLGFDFRSLLINFEYFHKSC